MKCSNCYGCFYKSENCLCSPLFCTQEFMPTKLCYFSPVFCRLDSCTSNRKYFCTPVTFCSNEKEAGVCITPIFCSYQRWREGRGDPVKYTNVAPLCCWCEIADEKDSIQCNPLFTVRCSRHENTCEFISPIFCVCIKKGQVTFPSFPCQSSPINQTME